MEHSHGYQQCNWVQDKYFDTAIETVKLSKTQQRIFTKCGYQNKTLSHWGFDVAYKVHLLGKQYQIVSHPPFPS